MPDLAATPAQSVAITDDTLRVDLSDGRTIAVPLEWFPRLVHATSKERNHWRLLAQGIGINWPDLDEDISVENQAPQLSLDDASLPWQLSKQLSQTSVPQGRRSPPVKSPVIAVISSCPKSAWRARNASRPPASCSSVLAGSARLWVS